MERIWWSRVPNALTFSSEIVDHLVNEKSIILHSEYGIPWYPEFIDSIKMKVEERISSKSFKTVDGGEEPGPYLLNECCKKEKRALYRPTKSHAFFFAQSDDIVLHSLFFLVNISSEDQLEKWQTFISEYVRERPKGKEKAVFLLSWKGQKPHVSKKGVKLISFEDYVSDYDRIVFSTMASSSVKEPALIKDYLTELSAILLGNDIELCGNCLNNYREFLENPLDVISKVAQTRNHYDGTPFVFDIGPDEIRKRIWQAQIRSIYPVLEEFREHFVSKHHAEIHKELPIESAYGEKYFVPEDVELGALIYMAGSGKLILTEAEYNRLKTYKEARNTLSHLNTLTLKEIKELM